MKISEVFFSFLFFLTPLYVIASCNHDVVDRDPRFACITVINNSNKNLAVTGYPGFNLAANAIEETMLLPFGNLVKVTPNPYSPYEEEKQLSCEFPVKIARENKIVITYKPTSYEVQPIEFKNNCTFKVVWE